MRKGIPVWWMLYEMNAVAIEISVDKEKMELCLQSQTVNF